MGGETGLKPVRLNVLYGLSPRGRGNRGQPRRVIRSHRSIPAWAGKPDLSEGRDKMAEVYPRVGGETDGHAWIVETIEGLSPRGRGNHRNADLPRR